ncbi:hypothetical protein SCLCIDRAFT_22307 [Scleroderma citrinum Foug A]|uniref:Heterokaryon incompatibility domain-containing protein n=1 Tax=Scleroderma citrinum Foug A TaxID=1036808 RepID=A0A0C3DZZ5_9AGAM|nr:hypothetical protein SCLCIDRAFT_22307 [Scleroderma citrinum Foug A]
MVELPNEAAQRQRREAAGLQSGQRMKPLHLGPRHKMFNINTYKFHVLGDYAGTIKMFGTTDSYTTQIMSGELAHQIIKRFYGQSNKKNVVNQFATQEQRHTVLRQQREALDPGVSDTDSGDDDPEVHHVMMDIPQHDNTFSLADLIGKYCDNPAMKPDFVQKLKNHLLLRLLGLDYDGDEQSFSPEDQNSLCLTNQRMVKSKIFWVNYTTYDIRHDQDVLCAFRVQVRFCPGSVSQPKRSMEVLWVRWLGVDPDHQWGFKQAHLPKIGFVPNSNEAFGFLDPSLVIRGCHIIPAFVDGCTDLLMPRGQSISRWPGEVDDWRAFYVNIFVDHDIFAHFAGIGVSHDAVNLGQVPALSISEDNEVDEEACRESEEPNTLDENRELSDSEAGCSDDENDNNTEKDSDLGDVSNDSEVDKDVVHQDLMKSKWFKRGWMLQELLTPRVVRFYDKTWTPYVRGLEYNHKLVPQWLDLLEKVTGIPVVALQEFSPGTKNPRERLRWASSRSTTRVEDLGYCLFGIFNIALQPQYGEGEKVFWRLLLELIRTTQDTSLFDWVGKHIERSTLFPLNPSGFREKPLAIDGSRSSTVASPAVSSGGGSPESGKPNSTSWLWASGDGILDVWCYLHTVKESFRVTPGGPDVQHVGNVDGVQYVIRAENLMEFRIVVSLNHALENDVSSRKPFVVARPWEPTMNEQSPNKGLIISSWKSHERDSGLLQPFSAMLLVKDLDGCSYSRIPMETRIVAQLLKQPQDYHPTLLQLS